VCRLHTKAELGELSGQRLGLGVGDHLAPFDRPVAVRADLPPIDGEHGTLPTLQSGQPGIADDPDEFLAKRPRSGLVDVAFQAQQAARWHLAGFNFVHGSAPSGKSINERGDKVPLGGVGRGGRSPKRRDPLRDLGRVQRQPFLDDGQRDAHLAERGDQPCLFELGAFVVAIAGLLVDACG
jgi:hypothetical protein